jgi:drug/metabolite transporter (DMT)-like permease
MNYILAAILSNLSYATADIGNGLASKKNSSLKNSFWVVFYSLIIFFVPAILFFQHEIVKLNLSNILWIFGTGILVILGYLSFLIGMTKGSITLTGVIGGSFPAVTTVAALLLFGEQVSTLQGIAIAAVLFGVVLSSLQGDIRTFVHDLKNSAIIYAFATFFLWGLYFALIRIPIESVGWFLPQYGASVIGVPIYFLIAYFTGEKDVLKKPNGSLLLIVITVLQVLGSLCFNYAIANGNTSIVAPISGSSPAVFVILAHFVFKEKIKPIQTVGIVTTVLGVISLSLLSA